MSDINKYTRKEEITVENDANSGRNNSISVALSNYNAPHHSSRNLRNSISQTSNTPRKQFNFTKQELEKHCDVSQKDAAKKLKCSWSTLKRACRKLKFRWPFKKNKYKRKLSLKHEEIDHSHKSIAEHMVINQSPCMTMHTPSATSEYCYTECCYTEQSGVSSNEGAVSGYDMNFTLMSSDNSANANTHMQKNGDWDNKQRSQAFAYVEYPVNNHLLEDNRDLSIPFSSCQFLSKMDSNCEQYSTSCAQTTTAERYRLYSPYPTSMDSNRGDSLSNVSNGNSRARFNLKVDSSSPRNRGRFDSDVTSINVCTEMSEKLSMFKNFPRMEQNDFRSYPDYNDINWKVDSSSPRNRGRFDSDVTSINICTEMSEKLSMFKNFSRMEQNDFQSYLDC